MKVCCECGVEKQLNDFSKDAKRKDGRGSRCHTCNRAVVNKWSAMHRDKKRAEGELYRRTFPEQAKEANRRYREKLTDGYIRTLISQDGQLKPSDVSDDLIFMKREQVLLTRLNKTLSNFINEVSIQGEDE